MLQIGKCCWYGKHIRLLKVAGGDEISILHSNLTSEEPFFEASQDGTTTQLIFQGYGFIIVEDYKKGLGTAKKLLYSRPLEMGKPLSTMARIEDVKRYPTLEKELLKQKIKPTPAPEKLVILYPDEIAIGHFNQEDGKFSKECWIITTKQKDDLFNGLPMQKDFQPQKFWIRYDAGDPCILWEQPKSACKCLREIVYNPDNRIVASILDQDGNPFQSALVSQKPDLFLISGKEIPRRIRLQNN